MSARTHLILKELRQLFQLKYIAPLLIAPALFVAMGAGFSGAQTALADDPTIVIVDHDDGQLSETLVQALRSQTEVIAVTDTSAEAARDRVRSADGRAVVVIPDGFTERIRNSQSGRLRTYSVIETVNLVGVQDELAEPLATAEQRLAAEVTGATTVKLQPLSRQSVSVVNGRTINATPGELSSVFFSQILFIPVVIAVVVLFAGQMVMKSMGIEKEHGTLEMLLTMPVPRRTLVMAKLIGSSVVGFGGAALYVVSLAYYQSAVGDSGSAASTAVSLGVGEYLLIGASLMLTLLCGLGIALCLGTFLTDQQGVQTYLLPLSAAAFVPAGVTVFSSVESLTLPLRLAVLAIPFTHPIIAPKQLLFGDPLLVYAGIGYQLVFAVATGWLAIRIFDSDRIVTGGTGDGLVAQLRP